MVVFEFNTEHTAVTAFLEPPDHQLPIDNSFPGDGVTPPALSKTKGTLIALAEYPRFVELLGDDFRVLEMNVAKAIGEFMEQPHMVNLQSHKV